METIGPAFIAPSSVWRVDVTGDDRARYLEDVTSQHLIDVPVTHVRGALVLDAHGGPQAMFDVVVLGDRLVLLAPAVEVRDTILDVLAGRTFLLDARFEAVEHAGLALRGEGAMAAASAVGLGVLPGRCRLLDDLLLVHREPVSGPTEHGATAEDAVSDPDEMAGVDLVGPPEVLEDARRALLAVGVRDGTEADLERWRIRAKRPAWGREVVAPHLPEEAGVLASHVHLAKGCYPGQEAVARMWMLGRPRRRLALVALAGAAAQQGFSVGTGRDAVGVTSLEPEDGTGSATDVRHGLAFVPPTASAGDRLGDAGDGEVRVLALIGDESAPPGHDPAVVRRRDRR